MLSIITGPVELKWLDHRQNAKAQTMQRFYHTLGLFKRIVYLATTTVQCSLMNIPTGKYGGLLLVTPM